MPEQGTQQGTGSPSATATWCQKCHILGKHPSRRRQSWLESWGLGEDFCNGCVGKMLGFSYPPVSRRAISVLFSVTGSLALSLRAQPRGLEPLGLDIGSHKMWHEFPRPLRTQFINILRQSFASRLPSRVSLSLPLTPLGNQPNLFRDCAVQPGVQVGFKCSRTGGSWFLQNRDVIPCCASLSMS